MGRFRVTVTAVGGHGCQRELKDGAVVVGCGQESCPDCAARAFVDRLKDQGCSVGSATIEHWPGEEHHVTDDLVSGVRQGSF